MPLGWIVGIPPVTGVRTREQVCGTACVRSSGGRIDSVHTCVGVPNQPCWPRNDDDEDEGEHPHHFATPRSTAPSLRRLAPGGRLRLGRPRPGRCVTRGDVTVRLPVWRSCRLLGEGAFLACRGNRCRHGRGNQSWLDGRGRRRTLADRGKDRLSLRWAVLAGRTVGSY